MLPMNQNINVVSLLAAIAGIFAYFFPNIPEKVRDDIIYLALAFVVVLVPFLHTLINHPANQEKVRALLMPVAKSASQVAKKIGPVLTLGATFGFALVALSACATAQSAPVSPSADPLQKVAQFTVADLQAADADAVANKDDIAHACYPALAQFIQSLPSSNAGTTVVGAFSAFQKARDLRNVAFAGIPEYLTMGCGPLYAQVHGDLLAFLATGAAAVAVP